MYFADSFARMVRPASILRGIMRCVTRTKSVTSSPGTYARGSSARLPFPVRRVYTDVRSGGATRCMPRGHGPDAYRPVGVAEPQVLMASHSCTALPVVPPPPLNAYTSGHRSKTGMGVHD